MSTAFTVIIKSSVVFLNAVEIKTKAQRVQDDYHTHTKVYCDAYDKLFIKGNISAGSSTIIHHCYLLAPNYLSLV